MPMSCSPRLQSGSADRRYLQRCSGEILFGFPGLGSSIYQGILQSDYNLIMGTITISVISVALTTFVIDLLYPFLDPRIRYSYENGRKKKNKTNKYWNFA